MAEINLLQVDNKKGIVSFTSAYRYIRLLAGGFIVLLVPYSLTFIAGIYLSRDIESGKTRQEQLSQQIKALSATEQKLVLIKDRINKVRSIKSKDVVLKSFIKINEFSRSLPEGVQLEFYEKGINNVGFADGNLEVVPSESKVSFTIGSSDNLRELNKLVMSTDQYSNIIVDNVLYNPVSGLSVRYSFHQEVN